MRFSTLVLSLLILPALAFAAEQKVTLNVSGNCGSCKKRIVKAAESIDGVKDAAWDKKTKVFTAVYDDAKTKPEAIKKVIADAGYDVENVKGNDEAYSKLPDCCRYRDKTHE
ncbi:MAG: ATPase [Candidatus Kapabacteria bacterium]|nr:ATPase [Candidatus Kapabacteria bacterium]